MNPTTGNDSVESQSTPVYIKKACVVLRHSRFDRSVCFMSNYPYQQNPAQRTLSIHRPGKSSCWPKTTNCRLHRSHTVFKTRAYDQGLSRGSQTMRRVWCQIRYHRIPSLFEQGAEAFCPLWYSESTSRRRRARDDQTHTFRPTLFST
jgi:hypothetical protein